MDLKSRILAIAIALVLTFFIFYGIETFYPAPKWDDYCKPMIVKVDSKEFCEQNGGQWQYSEVQPVPRVEGEKAPDGYCDTQYQCRQDYDDVNDVYERNVFFVGLVFGILLFIIGYMLHVDAVASGILGGATLILFWTVMRYWDHLHDYFRLIVLGIVLMVLIYIGYKKIGPKPKRKK